MPSWIKTPEEDAHTHHPRHQVFSGSKKMSYSCSAASKKRRNNFALVYTKINKNFREEYAYSPFWAPGITGTEADVILMFGELKKTQK